MQTQATELSDLEKTLLGPTTLLRRLVADGRLDPAAAAELEQAVGKLLNAINHVHERDVGHAEQMLAALAKAKVEPAALRLALAARLAPTARRNATPSRN